MNISLNFLKTTDCSFHGIVPGSPNVPGTAPSMYLWTIDCNRKTKGWTFRKPIQKKHESELTGKQQILTSSRNGAKRCIPIVILGSAMPLLAHFFCGCPRGLFSISANFGESAGSFSGLHVLAADEIVSD
jgi:hypothetical protein